MKQPRPRAISQPPLGLSLMDCRSGGVLSYARTVQYCAYTITHFGVTKVTTCRGLLYPAVFYFSLSAFK